jgi:diacylglycerol kinase
MTLRPKNEASLVASGQWPVASKQQDQNDPSSVTGQWPLAPGHWPSKRRLWRDKFRESLRGIKLGIRGHSSFFVHFFFAALVSATAIVLRCDPLEWCLLLGCIGLVLTAELFNSAVETIYHGLDENTQPRVRHCLDIAAGAVLLASITAAVIGAIVFLPKLAALLVHFFD